MLSRLIPFVFFISLSVSVAYAQTPEQGDKGFFAEMGRAPDWYWDQNKKVNAAISALQPERPGVVDAYVVVAGLDGDGVFGKEAAETAKLLSGRYDAVGRTVALAVGDGDSGAQASANSANLMAVLAGVAEKMNKAEDVLVLYTTSHGGPGIGIVFKDTDKAFGLMSANRMAETLNGLGITRRLVMVSACYSGSFVTTLKSDETVVVTAASADRSSFGCHPGNDWTFFGDALINGELRKPLPLETSVKAAFKVIGGWETKYQLKPSEPQLFVGAKTKPWLDALEKRMPKATSAKVGRPAIEGLEVPLSANGAN
jgi:hypothetical protein